MSLRPAVLIGLAVGVVAAGAGWLLWRSEDETRIDGVAHPDRTVSTPTLAVLPGAHAKPPVHVNPATRSAVRGMVVDPDGRPVSEAFVSFWNAPAREVRTYDDGSFVLGIHREDCGPLRVRVADPRWITARADVDWSEGTRIQLVRACELRVAVSCAGTPVAAARVRALTGNDASRLRTASGVRWIDEATTDAGGRAALRAPAGEVDVWATAAGFGAQRSGVTYVGASGVDVRVEMERAGTLDVRTTGTDGSVLRDALVHVVCESVYEETVRTGADGVAGFSDVPVFRGQRRRAVSVRAAGRGPTARFLWVPTAAGVESLEILVPPGRVLSGRVLSSEGSPLAGAEIRADPDSIEWSFVERERPSPATAVADAEGRFILEPVAPGPTRVAAYSEGSNVGTVVLHVPETGPVPEATIRAADRRGRSFLVRVFDPGGRPMPDVSVWPEVEETHDSLEGVASDASGVARFEGLPAVPMVFRADPDDPGWLPRAVRADLRDPAVAEAEIRIPGGSLAGRVLLADGSPARLEVRLERLPSEGWESGWIKVATDSEGRFRFDALGPQSYELTGGDGRWELVAPPLVRAGMPDLDLLLVAPEDADRHRATLTLLDDVTSEPIVEAEARIDGSETWLEWTHDEPGRYRTPPLPAGRYDVWVDPPGRPAAVVVGVPIAPGRNRVVRVRLSAGAALEGRVVSSDGRISDGWIGTGDDWVDLAADGTYRLSGLTPGRVELWMGGAYLREAHPVVTTGIHGSTTHADFTLEPAGAIVVRSAGRPPEGARVEVTATPLAGGEAPADRNIIGGGAEDPGHLGSLYSLAPGRYRVVVTVDGVVTTREVDVRALEDAVVTID